MKTKSDIAKLINGCKQQDWSAQKELYMLYADEMMTIAIRYSKDLSAAKDLVQDCFMRFFDKIENFDLEKGTPGAWISRILINRALQNIKKEKRLDFDSETIFMLEPSRETSIIETLQAEDILKLLEELPANCRLIFNLKVVEGYRHKEIATMLGISAGTSRAQLTRAKKLLRVLIEKHSFENTDHQNEIKAG